MSTPSVRNNYPFPDSTSQIQRALFPNVELFCEDDDAESRFREEETIVRFNSIVKAPGIVAKKGSESVYMAPAGITGNQISISAGIGYTENGARIVLESSLSIIDATLLTGYVASLSTSLYLVLVKTTEDYFPRSNPITGQQYSTRRRLLFDNTIVRWMTSSDLINSRDVVVLGRRITNSIFTFDLTESTGKRVILRVTEVPTLDTTGGSMSGDIDMQGHEILNLPDINTVGWRYVGAASKRDLIRLYAKTNYTIGLLGEITFEQNGANYRLRFGDDSGVKIKLLNNQRPPVSVNIINTSQVLNVPDNHVVQIVLTDSQLLASSSIPVQTEEGEFDPSEIDGDSINNPSFQTAAFDSTTNQFDFHKIPIGYHLVNGNSHKFIFANGIILNLGESIDSTGKYSGYVRRDGESVMTGSLRIKRNSGVIELIQETINDTTIDSGLVWKNTTETTIGFFKRVQIATESDSSIVPDVPLSSGDLVLAASKFNGSDTKYFIFKQDGRLQQPNAPGRDNIDLVRVGELTTLLNGKYNTSGGTLSGNVTIQKLNPLLRLVHKGPTSNEDSAPISEINPIGGIEWYNKSGVLIGGVIRKPTEGEFVDGDLEIISKDRDGASSARLVLRRNLNRVDVHKLLVGSTARIGYSMEFVPTDELPHTDTSEDSIRVVAPTGSAVYTNHLHPQLFAKQKILGTVQSAAMLNWPAPLRTLSNSVALTTSYQTIVVSLADAVPWQGQYLLIATANYSYDYSGSTQNNFITAQVLDRVNNSVLPGAGIFTSSAGGYNTGPVQQTMQFIFVLNLIPSEELKLQLKKEYNAGVLSIQSANLQLIHLF